jgi:hypothetical protein
MSTVHPNMSHEPNFEKLRTVRRLDKGGRMVTIDVFYCRICLHETGIEQPEHLKTGADVIPAKELLDSRATQSRLYDAPDPPNDPLGRLDLRSHGLGQEQARA